MYPGWPPGQVDPQPQAKPGEFANPGAATAAYAELLTDQQRILGPAHLDTLATRHNLAYWQIKADDTAGP
jgi:hypothetical protein